jgi:hypothetical protein
MKRRGVSLEQVRRTLKSPDWTGPDPDDPDTMRAWKRVFEPGGSRILCVVYNHVRQPWIVVTVFFRRRLRRKL